VGRLFRVASLGQARGLGVKNKIHTTSSSKANVVYVPSIQFLNLKVERNWSVATSAMKECPICVDSMEEGVELCTTPCKHEFHKTCLISYADYNRNKDTLLCPVCRHVILERSLSILEDQQTRALRHLADIYGEDFARYMLNLCVCVLLLLGFLVLLITILFTFGRGEEHSP
jgi:hypothetical protein